MLSVTTIHCCFIRPPPTNRLSRPSPYIMSAICFTEATSTLILNRSTVSSPVSGVASLSLSLAVSLTPVDSSCPPLVSTKRFQMKSISMCVLVCVFSLSHTQCALSLSLSLSLRRASFHSSLAQIHALGAAFKRKPVHSPSQSDMGLTRTNRFLDSVRVRDFWGLRFFFIYIHIYFLHRSSWNESGRKKRKENGYMSYDNFEHSCEGRPWVEAILIV